MKSREEYEASIFAKRNAVLAKRKKKIQMTVSAMSIIICLSAAAFAMPKLTDKADEAALPSANNAASGKGITENKIKESNAVFDEIGTFIADYDVTKAHSNHTAVFDATADVEETEEVNDEIEHLTRNEIYSMPETEIALETEIAVENGAEESPAGDKQFGFESPDGGFDIESIEPSSSSKKTYTTEEITAAAESCLSASDAENIISDKTNAVVSRKSDGTTTYTVYFYTSEKKITVKLSDSLELIEITEKDNAGGTSQIAPAYNPNA